MIFKDSLENIIDRGADYLSAADLDLIRRAYEFTLSSFNRYNLIRYSGEAAIIHPLAVAETLVDWRMDGASIAAGILHDIIEDCQMSAFQLHATFKDEVTFLVEGMTKLRRLTIDAGMDESAAYHHHIFLASASDIRVAIIKLADRQHNMRTLEYLPAKKRNNNCVETRKIFIPLARFLGMKDVKGEFEDITLMFLDEDGFGRTKAAFLESQKIEDDFFTRVTDRMAARMRELSIPARVSFVPYNLAHYHDEYLAAPPSGEKLSGFINVVVRGERECYAALGATHSLFEPVQGGFHDTITYPTADLKRWIETRVHDAGSRFKVRVVSEEMNHVNSMGIIPYLVAPSDLDRTDFLQERLREIQDILHQMKNRSGSSDVEYITADLFRNEIFVITARQDRVSLPPDSTVLDFAYRVDEQLANQFKSAIVNTRIVGIQHILHSCDKVEIETDPGVRPTVEWLGFAKTPNARMLIKKSLADQPRESARASGREFLTRAVNRVGLIHTGKPNELEILISPVAEFLGMKDLAEFFENVGFGEISIEDAIDALRTQKRHTAMLSPQEQLPIISGHPVLSREYPLTIIKTEKPLSGAVHLCEVCTPIPGDEIEIRIQSKKITVHTATCRQSGGKIFQRSKKAAASWDQDLMEMFPARLRLKLFRQEDTYSLVQKAISEKGARFVAMQSGKISSDGLELLEVVVEVTDRSMLGAVENAVMFLRDVVVVTRI